MELGGGKEQNSWSPMWSGAWTANSYNHSISMQTLHFSLVVQYWINYMRFLIQSKSVQFSHSIVSDSLQPHGLQHARPPCPSSTPRVYPNSCPSSQWCHPTISSSVIHFSTHLQSFPVSGSFQMSQLFINIRWPKY